MKRYVFAGMAFCLVVSYQNCSRGQFSSDTTSSNALSNPTEVDAAEKADPSQTEIVEVPESSYLESQLQSAIQQSQPTSILASHHLEINVKTGVVNVVDQNGDAVNGLQYCLSSDDQDELSSILNSSKICEEKIASNSDMNCALYYISPYAKLHLQSTEVALGEATSSCHKGPDLCGSEKDMLQSFLADFQANLATKKCSFQVVNK